MKNWYLILLALSLLFGSAWVVMADPLDFTLPWATVDGGGGAISAAPYTLYGTIGQPDVGLLQGGSYTIKGGFLGGGLSGPTSTPSPTLPPTVTPGGPTLTPTIAPPTITPGGPTVTASATSPVEPTATATRTPAPPAANSLYLPLVKNR